MSGTHGFDIVIALYNKEQFVRATVESVLAQSFADWRLFVVDDGSTDGVWNVVSKFEDSRITLIRQKNQGVGPARNAGIRAGTSEWIAFLDADDLWTPDHLSELDQLRLKFPDAALIGSGYRRFKGIAPPVLGARSRATRRVVRYFHESARNRPLFATSSAATTRKAIAEVGDFKPLPGNEDVELWARLALHGPVAVSSKRTMLYRVESGGFTNQGDLQRRTRRGPMIREELSSVMPTLDARLPTISSPELRRDIVEYMDSRIGLSLVAAMRWGDVAYARHLRSLYSGRPLGKARLASGLALLPPVLARLIVRTAILPKAALGMLAKVWRPRQRR